MRILGISPLHDSSVAIVNDGVLEYFCKEERLSRVKRDSYPVLAIEEALKHSKGKIDMAVISSPTFTAWDNYFISLALKKRLKIPVSRLCHHHHLTHAGLAFYNSGFKKALVVVIDRNGSDLGSFRESETVFTAEYPFKFKPLYKTFWTFNKRSKKEINKDLKKLKWNKCKLIADSAFNITKVYETGTTLIGQHPLENGKTMGLAAYGIDKDYPDLFIKDRPNSKLFTHQTGFNEPAILKAHIKKKVKNVPTKNFKFYADHAFQVQKQTQQQVLNLVKKYVNKTKINKVCLTGGYALNVVTNEYLVKNLPDVEFYFEPLADDSGNSIGAALVTHYNETKDKTIRPLKHTFFNNTKHTLTLRSLWSKFQRRGLDNLKPSDVAHHLSKGKIVAVYNGVAEGGPRALGNRSILFDPRNTDAKNIVNQVKKREWYRPFAASVLETHFTKMFHTHGLTKSPFMTLSFQVKCRGIPGVIHVDNSCRVQTVSEENGYFYNLLNEFYSITKVPALLNTSFNLAGEPLIETIEEAIDAFNNTGIDVLWFPENNKGLIK